MEHNEPVTIYTLQDPIRAELIKNLLNGEGISCFLDGLNQAETAGLPGIDIKVQVPAEDADRAAKLIASHEERD